MCGIAAERANEDAGRTRRRPRAGRYGLTLILAVALAVGCVAPASAADPDAPPGASADWLPDEPWVGQHWLPYHEMRLVRSLGMSYKDLRRWMIHRPGPLSRLIRERGLDPGRLARRLVAQSRATASRAMYRELLDRTMRTFTQPHLVRHMFGHPFHQWSWQRRTERIFGVSKREVARRHSAGESMADIAADGGRSYPRLVAAMRRWLRVAAQEGIRTGQTPAAQGRRWYRRQISKLPEWLRRRKGRRATAAAHSAAAAVPGLAPLCRLT
jgi:hypothetical protein